jgi:hypothetical protein
LILKKKRGTKESKQKRYQSIKKLITRIEMKNLIKKEDIDSRASKGMANKVKIRSLHKYEHY